MVERQALVGSAVLPPGPEARQFFQLGRDLAAEALQVAQDLLAGEMSLGEAEAQDGCPAVPDQFLAGDRLPQPRAERGAAVRRQVVDPPRPRLRRAVQAAGDQPVPVQACERRVDGAWTGAEV